MLLRITCSLHLNLLKMVEYYVDSFDADVFATIVDGEGRFLCENTHPKLPFPPVVFIFLSTSLTRLYIILFQ